MVGEYVYRSAHPALRWLPTMLAEWIGENLQEELGSWHPLIVLKQALAGLLQS
jgi:hypothetical protein